MKLESNQPKATAEHLVRDIRRATRRHYSTEDKIRIVSLFLVLKLKRAYLRSLVSHIRICQYSPRW